MEILLIDNDDSFTYNLFHLLCGAGECCCGVNVEVLNCGEANVESAMRADGVVLSPGPGLPHENESLMGLVEGLAGRVPILGVCLGHQALAVHYGARLIHLSAPCHGDVSCINIKSDGRLFAGIGGQMLVARYHSWSVGRDGLPEPFQVTAETVDGCVMAFEHRSLPLFGVQFHPESFMTPQGKQIIKNYYHAILQFNETASRRHV
ncbi:MAG: gamma-glutamyl-gamma-aminobutyrate hydrolase family protein [Prevotella sp.]|nr:gamma-glutamyl-gamma-aminobutyrate hydrolase family protein [Prevotella sp.]